MEVKVADLKNKIQEGSIGDSLLLLVYSDTTFLANQYVNQISSVRKKKRVYIDGLDEVRINKDFFDSEDDSLYILNVDKFESKLSDFSPYKNTVVICKQLSDETKHVVKMTAVYSKLPELQEWQLLDYIKASTPGLTDWQRKFIYDISKGDVYRINNEIQKIGLFEPSLQPQVFYSIKTEGGYSDVSLSNVYNIKDALLKSDVKKLSSIILELKSMDVNFMTIVAVLHRDIKNIINVVLDKKATSTSLNMKEAQFKAIYGNYGKLDSTKLSNLFEFITSIDFNLKSGLLQMQDERLIDYLIVKVLSILN